VEVKRTGDHPIPEEYRNRIFIHTVHDGDSIPREFVLDEDGQPLVEPKALERRFIEERDWGADLVARKIASAMGVPNYGRARIARVLLDFNRFPGSTPHDGDDVLPLERQAINYPFSSALDHTAKVRLLEKYYDGISDFIEDRIQRNTLIMIAVHTYDEHNPTRTRRPHLSLLSSMAGYQRNSRMPFGIFDPMYPDILGESTCSRILRDRISLNIERTGMRVSHNHPYPLPEGSMEVRAQVWFFFDYLRRRFVADFPETAGDPAYELVWRMLLNTNLRMAEAEALRSYLHRYRRLVPDDRQKFNEAQLAYDTIGSYLGEDLVKDFRLSRDRLSSLGLEIRKDLVTAFDPETGHPLPTTTEQVDQATLIGNVVANAITTYFETDIHFL
jgi:hypothetical protein